MGLPLSTRKRRVTKSSETLLREGRDLSLHDNPQALLYCVLPGNHWLLGLQCLSLSLAGDGI